MLVGSLLAATVALGLLRAADLLPPAHWPDLFLAHDGLDLRGLLVRDSLLARAVAALFCGGALALAGSLLQLVLRNPLAEPGTLAIAAGAHLALAFATVFAPAFMVLGREMVALAGGALAMAGVFTLSWRSHLAPLAVVLAGLVVGLYCTALGTLLVLFNEHDLAGLFIWGSGSLNLQDWTPVARLLLPLAAGALASGVLARPLGPMSLGDTSARSLGLALAALRAGALATAVGLTAAVVSNFGVIGFVGLGGPLLARLAGARRTSSRLLWGSLVGAGLLGATDMLIQVLAAGDETIPTGAATALLGAPLLFLLLPQLPQAGPGALAEGPVLRRRSATTTLGLLAALSICLVAGAVICGRSAEGWSFSLGTDFEDLLPWRLPRVLGAGAAGIMLATAGCILQRLVGNPMASPELLGISAGALLGSAAALFLGFAGSPLALPAAGMLGALAVLAALMQLVRRAGFLSERILIAGLALTAILDAGIAALTATGDPRAMLLLSWMTGSTYRMDATMAGLSCLAALLLFPIALTLSRWLDILPLGQATARALGLSPGRAQIALLGLAGALTAAGTLVTGPLSFVGLMAPHLARLCGLQRASAHLAGSALIGAVIMVLADWLGRFIDFPWQIPGGLVAGLVAGPGLMLLLARGGR